MRLFMAAGEAGEYWDPNFDDVLVSYASPSVRNHPPMNKNWFLDSGAFSFFQWGMDGTAVLDDYIKFLLQTQHRRYPVLDVIGKPSSATWANDQKMRAAGLDPIAVVHFGEPHTEILKYLDAGITNIALGGYASAGVSVEVARRWIDAVFSHIGKRVQAGQKMPRIHGFGMTNESVLIAYPFYSVDSTVWLVSRRYGEVLIWNSYRRKMSQINPKDAEAMNWAVRDFGVPLAAIDGYSVADARDIKAAWNIMQMLELADFVTTLWAKRGITWDDEPERIVSTEAERAFLRANWPEALGRFKTWTKRTPVWAKNAS